VEHQVTDYFTRDELLDRLSELLSLIEDRSDEKFAALATYATHLAQVHDRAVDQTNAAFAKYGAQIQAVAKDNQDKNTGRVALEVVNTDRKRTVVKDVETDETGRILRVIERVVDE
jgi:tRNA isopentenyl-2-thiomethyl-A-37 hydroxylase MiaE